MSTDLIVDWVLPSLGLVAWLGLVVMLLPRLLPLVTGRGDQAHRWRRWDVLVALCLFALGAWVWALVVPLPTSARALVVDDLQPWFWGTVVLIVFLTVSFPLLRRVLSLLTSRADRTQTDLDDVLVASVRRPAQVLLLLAAFVLWMDIVPAPRAMSQRVGTVAEAAVVVVLVLFADAMIGQVIERRRARSRILSTTGSVLRSMARVVLFIIGLLMVLGTMGIDITPVAASLGVGSLAIGLALQSTLEDFIAGLLIAADQPVSMGDFVQIGDASLSGTVEAIGWRTTRLLTLEQTKVIVPNSTLARATLVNRSRPTAVVRFQAQVGVHYDSNLGDVARAVQEVAAELQASHPFGTPGFEPVVTFYQFGDSSIDLRVWLEASDWVGHYRLLDGFIRALHVRFAAEGIIVPYPIRTVDLSPSLVAALDPRRPLSNPTTKAS